MSLPKELSHELKWWFYKYVAPDGAMNELDNQPVFT